MVQGKGFVFFGLRFQGWELAIGNVYLESGNGPGARANPAILAVLIMALQELQQPWMVAGDWNCSPQDLQSSTTFMRAVRGRVIAPSEATTCQGSDIDSAVTRVELQAYVSVEVEWDVPFKPHGALRYRVQRRALHCLCCRFQICQFGQDPMTPPDQPVERQPCGKVEALYEVVHAKNSLAEIKQIELEAGMPGQGRAWCFPAKREPMIASKPLGQASQGGKVAYWGRILLWAMGRSPQTFSMQALPERTHKACGHAATGD